MDARTTAERLEAIRVWLGFKYKAQLARVLGVQEPTYRQWENPRRAKTSHHLESDLVEKLARVARMRGLDPGPLYAMAGHDVRAAYLPQGMADSGAARFIPAGGTPLERAILAFVSARPNREPWVMRDHGLALVGVMAGDVAIVDLSRRDLIADQIVLASITEQHSGWSRSVLRLFRPPYLVAMTHDQGLLTPILIDHDSVVLRGWVIAVIRDLLTA